MQAHLPEVTARRFRTTLVLAAATLALGSAAAAAWTCDDAFISFRYAENLAAGHGLVFNAGERVEGYTNPLWTVFIALGILLGIDAEAWSIGWGLAAYAALLAVFLRTTQRLAGAAALVPAGFLALALHDDLHLFATSGLETSAFTALSFAGYALTTRGLLAGRSLAPAGLVLAAATLTRPDGIVIFGVLALGVAACSKRRVRDTLTFVGAFALVFGPATWLRIAYYGDFFPNTYYAKSAWLPWYDQGLVYLALYLQKYGVLALGPCLGLGLLAWQRRFDPARDRDLHLALASVCGLAYAGYVVRVGGDFMYARLFIPTVPFFAIAFELVARELQARAPRFGPIAIGALLVTMKLTERPVSDRMWSHGVADEWAVYTPEQIADMEATARTVRAYTDGLPVRVAFLGTQARFVYLAGFPVAIESSAGLTEPEIAHQKLEVRGRPGHEKHATVDFLLRRRAHLVFSAVAARAFDLDRELPDERIVLGNVTARILYYDPEILQALAARGANYVPFEERLDRYIEQLPTIPREVVEADYAKARRFYFDHVDDPKREAAFTRRLAVFE